MPFDKPHKGQFFVLTEKTDEQRYSSPMRVTRDGVVMLDEQRTSLEAIFQFENSLIPSRNGFFLSSGFRHVKKLKAYCMKVLDKFQSEPDQDQYLVVGFELLSEHHVEGKDDHVQRAVLTHLSFDEKENFEQDLSHVKFQQEMMLVESFIRRFVEKGSQETFTLFSDSSD